MNFFDDFNLEHDKVLIVGKGPSMDHRCAKEPYLSVGLNHTEDVDVSHQIDWNCINLTHPKVIAPYFPLCEGKKSQMMLPELSNVYRYNFYCAPSRIGNTPVIMNDTFSIHCVLQIFAMKGVKKFAFSGVDGGGEYNYLFKHLKTRPSGYSAQFSGIFKIVDDYKLEIEECLC